VKSIKVYTFLLTEINVCNLIVFVQRRRHLPVSHSTVISAAAGRTLSCRPLAVPAVTPPTATEISLAPCHSTVTAGSHPNVLAVSLPVS